MALIKCHECGSEISTEAATCPKCGATPKTKTNTVKAVFAVIFVFGFLWFFFGGGWEQQAAKDMGKIEQQVAADAVAQYDIAKRGGNLIGICVQAGMVSAAFLQAKDEANYRAWQKTQKADCSKAGLPQ